MAENKTTPGATLTESGVDLHLELKGSGIRAGLTDALREAVRSGRLAPGTRLPASRTLAQDLGIARSTVTECYGTLVEEGWLTAKHGSGTRVAERVRPLRGTAPVPPSGPPRAPHGLDPGAADYADFPRAAWLGAGIASGLVMRRRGAEEADMTRSAGYSDRYDGRAGTRDESASADVDP